MSRTYRRKNQKYDYRWVLRDHARAYGPYSRLITLVIDVSAISPEGKKRLAKYHSDHAFVFGQAPREFRKLFKRSLRMGHRIEIARWLKNHDYPVQCDARTRHTATWAWW